MSNSNYYSEYSLILCNWFECDNLYKTNDAGWKDPYNK